MQLSNLINPINPIDLLSTISAHEDEQIINKNRKSNKINEPIFIKNNIAKSLLKATEYQKQSNVLNNYKLSDLLNPFIEQMSACNSHNSLLLAVNENSLDLKKHYERQWRQGVLLNKNIFDDYKDSKEQSANCIKQTQFITLKLEFENFNVKPKKEKSETATKQEYLEAFEQEMARWIHQKIIVQDALTPKEMYLIIMLEEQSHKLAENIEKEQFFDWELFVEPGTSLNRKFSNIEKKLNGLSDNLSFLICIKEAKKNEIHYDEGSENSVHFYQMKLPLLLSFLKFFGPTEIAQYKSFIEAQELTLSLGSENPNQIIQNDKIKKKIGL